MSDFLQEHPHLILIIFIGNAIWVSLFCYWVIRYWVGKQTPNNNEISVVTQYIIEPQPIARRSQEEPFSDVRNIIIVRPPPVISSNAQSTPDNDHSCAIDDCPPPSYFDIFPKDSITESRQ